MFKYAVVDANLVGMGLDVLESQHGAFLHDVAQVSCNGEFVALAAAQAGFDEKDFSAHARPGQARNDASEAIALIDVAIEGLLA